MDSAADEHIKAFNSGYGEQSKKFWSIYVSEAEQHDTNVMETWKADMDNNLIFAGLFSAVVTAFIIESYKLLNQDPNDVTTALLSQILAVQIMALASTHNNPSESITPMPPTHPTAFIPSASAIAVNFLWFFSLVCSLAAAFCVILVQRWVRGYLQRVKKNSQPLRRARDRAFLFEGMQKYRMDVLVENIPTLLHASLFFFFIGLCVYLFSTLKSANVAVTAAVLPPLIFCFLVYALATFSPLLDPSAPFETPFSSVLWGIQQRVPTQFTRYYRGDEQKPVPASANLVVAREQLALNPLSRHDSHSRDAHALLWSYRRVNDVGELQRFVESLLGFLECEDGRIAWRLVGRRSPESLKELELQINFLLFETSRAEYMDPTIKKRRADVCLKALYTISLYQQTEFPLTPPLILHSNSTLEYEHLPMVVQDAKGLGITKVICTASLMVHRALVTELRTIQLPSTLCVLSKKADQALKDVQTLRGVLNDVLTALYSSQSQYATDVGELLQMYFAFLHIKSLDILDCVNTVQHILPPLMNVSHSKTLLWHYQLPLISPLVIEYLDPVPYLGTSQNIHLYAHQILAFMHTTSAADVNRHPTLHSIPSRYEWFPMGQDMAQSKKEQDHLRRELEPVSLLLDHLMEPASRLTLRLKLRVGWLHETYLPVHSSPSSYSTIKCLSPVAPQGPFTTLTCILEDIRDDGRVIVLLELLTRLRHWQYDLSLLSTEGLSDTNPGKWALDTLSVIDDTINIITQPGPRNNPLLVLSEGSQILLVLLIRDIINWRRGLGVRVRRYPSEPPISQSSLRRLFDWFRIGLTHEISLRTAEEIFGLTHTNTATAGSRAQAVCDRVQSRMQDL